MPLLSPIYPLLLSVFILAEAPAPPAGDPASYQSAGWILMALGGLALTGNQIMSAMLNWRKLREPEAPTCPLECARLKVLETEIRAVEMRVEKRISEHLGSINTRLGTLEQTLTKVVADFNYALGKIDSQ